MGEVMEEADEDVRGRVGVVGGFRGFRGARAMVATLEIIDERCTRSSDMPWTLDDAEAEAG